MANETFALGEPISNKKKVRKVLRSLPKIFERKVTAIEEARDLIDMRLDDLIGNLTTCEMKFDSTALETVQVVVTGGLTVGRKITKPLEDATQLGSRIKISRINNKSYYTAHSDEDEGSDGPNNFVSFTTQILEEGTVTPTVDHTQPDNIYDDEEELTEEELIENYQIFFHKWSKLTQTYTTIEAERKHLIRENIKLIKVVKDKKMDIGF
ncbi:hypothetical protein LIER_34206 [Lithospermum erythrorhizon]|uniref:Uncharacterized protein n=1 Tax=Lithospermum erythrorhizon TaxID=34254 RepID=A0AAV3RZ06_LITER